MAISLFRKSRSRRAVILILSLWIAVILSVMAISIASELQINSRLARQNQYRLAAQGLARAGISKAVVDLQNDRLFAIADPTHWNADTLHDVWADAEDKTGVELDDSEGTYSVKIKDEESKINLNTLTPLNAPVLGYVIQEVMDMDQRDAMEIAYMILDWRDTDSVVSGGSGGYEKDVWTEVGLQRYGDTLPENWTYYPKNDLFFELDELLAIPGITREALHGAPEEESSAHRRRHRKGKDEEESKALEDYVTVQSAGYLNINTAPRVILAGLFGAALGGGGGANEGLADKVLDYREQQNPERKGSQTIMNALQQLQEAGIDQSSAQTINQMINLNNLSNFFTIVSRGSYKGVHRTIRTIANIRIEPYKADQDDRKRSSRRHRTWKGSLRNRSDHVIDPAVRTDGLIQE